MRPYRGQRIDNGKWVYGDKVTIGLRCLRCWIVSSPELTESDDRREVHCSIWGFVEVIPATVGQATGLTKNGKEIYTGMGGIHPNCGKYVVRLGSYAALNDHVHHGFYVEWQDERRRRILTPRLPLWTREDDMLFDMNIHDNPELLEGESNGCK